jgi:GTP cyclohydrolase I
MDLKKIKEGVSLILEGLGEDPGRPGLTSTPDRIAGLYSEIFSGIAEDPSSIIEPISGERHHEMVLVKDLTFYSMCEHHLLPFMGKAHIAYIPSKGRIVGVGNLARVLESLAKRPQVQERLTTQITETIESSISPLGTMVVVEAEHLCLSMRGARKEGSQVVTSAVRGVFRTNPSTREEMLSLIK